MNLDDIRDAYLSDGFNYIESSSRTSQDVILALISKSHFSKNVTIKGGVVLQHISGDSRRATLDFDFDFIKYSLSNESIEKFIKKLNDSSDDVSVVITAAIEDLKHQDYNGKRIYIRLSDIHGTSIDAKLDIGIHKDVSMKQDMYCFDLIKLDDSVNLLVNTKEQMFVEKLKSLLRLGSVTTRYKDIFDMYWLSTEGKLDNLLMKDKLKKIIFDDVSMRENNTDDIVTRLDRVFNDSHFVSSLGSSRRHNWLEIDPTQVTSVLLGYFRSI